MKYRKLGKTGIEVSEIGMGLEYLLDKEEQAVIDTIRAAVNGGTTYLDCHPAHDFNQTEQEIPRFYKRRDELPLCNKSFCFAGSYEKSLDKPCFL